MSATGKQHTAKLSGRGSLLMLLLLPISAQALEEDKLKHAAAGGIIGASVTVATKSKALGFAAGCVAGAAKEASDKSQGRKPDAKDFLATCLGAGISFSFDF